MRQNHFLQLVANPACIMANVYIAIAFAFLSFVAIWLHAGLISFVALIIVVGLTTTLAVFGMAIQVTMLVLSASREKADSQFEIWELEERTQLEIRLTEQTQLKALEKGYISPPLQSLPPLKNTQRQISEAAFQAERTDDDKRAATAEDRRQASGDSKTVSADKQADIDRMKVLTYFRKYPEASLREAEPAVGFGKDKIAKIIAQLKSEGRLP